MTFAYKVAYTADGGWAWTIFAGSRQSAERKLARQVLSACIYKIGIFDLLEKYGDVELAECLGEQS